jgi:predicted nuclease with TOPRIM domain
MNAKLVDSIVLMIHSLSPEEQTLFQNKLGVPAEMEVLQAIYQGIPSDVQQRYDELREKLHNETLSSDEHQELIKMIDVIEQYDVERLEKLIQLAKIRNVSLEELMKQLNLKPTVTHV